MKNEAWILERFLQCNSQWADHIIIADQYSDDGSREIASRCPKVILVDNPSKTYNEQERQKLLLDVARRIPGKRIIIALDADEMLTANWATSSDWEAMRQAAPGTVITFEWMNVMPDFQSVFVQRSGDIGDWKLGFVDDGSEHQGETIHSTRIPNPPDAPRLKLTEVGVLHYQYVDWDRMKSRQRWYQCWERINHPTKRPITLYRQYHHMDAPPSEQLRHLKDEWTQGYTRLGIDMFSVKRDTIYRWDPIVAGWLTEHGSAMFRKCDIWDVDWDDTCRRLGIASAHSLADPRSRFEKAVHLWLARTQGIALDKSVRFRQRLLRLFGW